MTLLSSLLAASIAAALLVATAAFRMVRAPLVPATAAAVGGLATGALLTVFRGLSPWIYPLAVIAAAIACSWARGHLRERVIEPAITGAVLCLWAISVMTLEQSASLPSPLLWTLGGAAGGVAWGLIRAPLPRLLLILFTAILWHLAGRSALADSQMTRDLVTPLIVVGALSILGIASELWQLSRLRSTLGEEAAWGILDPQLTERLISPIGRFMTPSGYDRQLWLEMVRISRRLGGRRLKQLGMDPSAARVQQIEVIRLRTRLMELQTLHRGANSPHVSMDVD